MRVAVAMASNDIVIQLVDQETADATTNGVSKIKFDASLVDTPEFRKMHPQLTFISVHDQAVSLLKEMRKETDFAKKERLATRAINLFLEASGVSELYADLVEFTNTLEGHVHESCSHLLKDLHENRF